MKHTIFAFPTLVALAACGGTTTETNNTLNAVEVPEISTSFLTPNVLGDFSVELENDFQSTVIDSAGNGYAYQFGEVDGVLTGNAGIVPGTSVTPTPAMGSAAMTGQYQVQALSQAVTGTNGIEASSFSQTSLITLTADFDGQTLSGDTANFEVNGTFTGEGLLAGNVTFNGQSASLSGLVGGEQAIGVFQGETDSGILVGGFNVAEQ